MLTTEQKAKAFDLFLKQVEDNIEKEIPNWLEENPYWEIDGDDGRPAYCPRTTEADAREALIESFTNQGEELGYSDFFEYVVYCIYGEPMSKTNKFRETKEEAPKVEKKEEVNPMETILKGQKQMLDMMFAPLEQAIEGASK